MEAKQMKKRIEELKLNINQVAAEIAQIKDVLKQKEASLISMRGGLLELQRLVKIEDAAKELESKGSEEDKSEDE